MPPAGSPVFAVHQEDIDPAVAVGIEKGSAGAEGFRQIFLAGLSGVMDELNPGLSRHIGKLHFVRGRRRSRYPQPCENRNNTPPR